MDLALSEIGKNERFLGFLPNDKPCLLNGNLVALEEMPQHVNNVSEFALEIYLSWNGTAASLGFGLRVSEIGIPSFSSFLSDLKSVLWENPK